MSLFSFTIEYTPPAVTPNAPPPKRLGSTLITPQAKLIDSLASRAIYLIEKKQLPKKTPKKSINKMEKENANENEETRITKSAPTGKQTDLTPIPENKAATIKNPGKNPSAVVGQDSRSRQSSSSSNTSPATTAIKLSSSPANVNDYFKAMQEARKGIK